MGGGGRRAVETSGEIFPHNTRDGLSQIQLCGRSWTSHVSSLSLSVFSHQTGT